MRPMIFYIGFVLLLTVGAIAYERMLWNECRLTNSWFYCVRVLGH